MFYEARVFKLFHLWR